MAISWLRASDKGTSVRAVERELNAAAIRFGPVHACHYPQSLLDELADGDAFVGRAGEKAMGRPALQVVGQHGQLGDRLIGRDGTSAQVIEKEYVTHDFVERLNRLPFIIELDQRDRSVRTAGQIADQKIVARLTTFTQLLTDDQANGERTAGDDCRFGLGCASMAVHPLPGRRRKRGSQMPSRTSVAAFDHEQVAAFEQPGDGLAAAQGTVTADEQ